MPDDDETHGADLGDAFPFPGASPLVARQIHLQAIHEKMTDAEYQERHWRNWLRLADPE